MLHGVFLLGWLADCREEKYHSGYLLIKCIVNSEMTLLPGMETLEFSQVVLWGLSK